MQFQRQSFSRIAASCVYIRKINSCSSKIIKRISIEDARLVFLARLMNGGFSTSNVSSPAAIPVLQSSIFPWVSRSGFCSDLHYNCISGVPLNMPQSILQQRIQEMIFPCYLPNEDKVIGNQESHELTIGNETREIPTVAFSSILKKRHKKMKKHKYRKRRKLEVFKRRHLQNIKDRKRRAKERKEERIQRQEASG